MGHLRPVGLGLVLAWLGCGGPADWDPGPAVRQVEYTTVVNRSPKVLLVVVVDDRATAQAEQLRTGVGAAMRRLAQTAVREGYAANSDPAAWHPVDVATFVVPASNAATDAMASPATDASLAWTTVHATLEGADALAAAVGEHAIALAPAPPGAPFRPLERARDVVRLLDGSRLPVGEIEARLVAIASDHWRIGVSVVAASDDESPGPPKSYWIGNESFGPEVVAGLVTPESGMTGAVDQARSPRLVAWAEDGLGPPISGCHEVPDTPFFLFPSVCVDYRPRCDGRPIEQPSPGLGSCLVEVTTFDSTCVKSRGWVDPMDSDGVRRPRPGKMGGRICEALPVDPGSMDACIHDLACDGCASGWCVTDVYRTNNHCPIGSMPRPIRWVGRVLPESGSVHVACRVDAGAL